MAHNVSRAGGAHSAWEVYEKLDLGPGGYAIGPSMDIRAGVRQALHRRHRRAHVGQPVETSRLAFHPQLRQRLNDLHGFQTHGDHLADQATSR